jgi:phosphatidylinositol alpha-mannosyltransferase
MSNHRGDLQKLNIAVISYGLPVVGEKRGGIERVAHALSNELAQRGHQVEVWTHDPKPEGALYEVRPLPWKRFVTTWLGRRVTMGYLGNLLALLPKYGEPDVILSHGDSLLLSLMGKPVVRVMHGSALAEALSGRSLPRFVMQSGVYAQEILTSLIQPGCVAVSHNMQGHHPFIRRVIPNGVDLSTFFPRVSEKTKEPSILFVGALGGRKRGSLLSDWFTRVVRPLHPAATLMMVSEPGRQLEGITYHTGVSDRELAALYRKAWIYASPSTYEGFGLPYLEAMASGTPVVATRNPGSREILNEGRFGRLVSDDEFASAVAELLSDTEQREKFMELGLSRAREYSLSAMADRYESLLAELCGRSMAPRRAFE